jgi:hypothetical protein
VTEVTCEYTHADNQPRGQVRLVSAVLKSDHDDMFWDDFRANPTHRGHPGGEIAHDSGRAGQGVRQACPADCTADRGWWPVSTLDDSATDFGLPGDAAFEAATRTFNLAAVPTPAVATTADTVADVQAALRYATKNGLSVRTYTTGHAAATFGPMPDALLIRTALRGEIEVNIALAGIESVGLLPRHPQRIHFTYLDPEHLAAGGSQHDSATVGDVMRPAYVPQIVLVSENKDTAIHFPPVPKGIAVEGAGFGGAEAIASIGWLTAARHLVYWGDLDPAGFEIVDHFRQAGLPVRTILMDLPTFADYERFRA